MGSSSTPAATTNWTYLAVAGFVALGALCLALIRRPMWIESTALAPKAKAKPADADTKT